MSQKRARPSSRGESRAIGSSLGRSRVAFCAATFLFFASLYVFVPILPVYAESIVDNLALVGVIIASYALPQLLFRIPMGVYFDASTKRKPIVVFSMLMCVGGAVGLAFAHSGGTLFLGRAMTGVGAAGWVAFTTFFTGYYPQSGSARALGTINAVGQAAIVVATGLGGLLADAGGYRTVFLVAAGLAALGVLALAFAHEPAMAVRERSSGDLARVATAPLLVASGVMAVLLQFATFSGTFGFIPSYGASIGASNSQLGVITMVTLAASAAAAVASVRVAERVGYPAALSLGAALLGGTLLLVPYTTTPEMLTLVQLVSGLGRGTLTTLLMALSIRAAPAGARATAMGVYQAVYAIGMLAGPLVSGMVADSLDFDAVFRLSAVLALAIVVVAQHPVVRRA
ncbi:MAG: MFS transporter [Dehalococcoidia bacterium]|nr:MFS transporter [Dehalococcoidia bacterium]